MDCLSDSTLTLCSWGFFNPRHWIKELWRACDYWFKGTQFMFWKNSGDMNSTINAMNRRF